jgi:DoxX-like protein
MIVAYWMVAGALGLLYLFSGVIKIVWSKDRLRPMMEWVDIMPLGLVRTIGVLEVLGALGLILPPLTGVVPGVALAAAIGLVVLQIGAIALHVSRRDVASLWLNGSLLALAGIATWLSIVWL